MKKIRILGDVHSKFTQYIDIVKDCDYSLQVGDMGFNYDKLEQLNPDRHKFIFGNHDRHPDCLQNAHCLGKYGVWHNIFYVSGAWSIDKKRRTIGVDWWEEEELTQDDLDHAIEMYKWVSPKVMVSHECPLEWVKLVTSKEVVENLGYGRYKDGVIPTRTNHALQEMLNYHKPKLYIFGHYHQDYTYSYAYKGEDKIFICLNELSYIDINLENFK